MPRATFNKRQGAYEVLSEPQAYGPNLPDFDAHLNSLSHLFFLYYRPITQNYCNTRVIGAKMFLVDFERSEIQQIRFHILALRSGCGAFMRKQTTYRQLASSPVLNFSVLWIAKARE